MFCTCYDIVKVYITDICILYGCRIVHEYFSFFNGNCMLINNAKLSKSARKIAFFSFFAGILKKNCILKINGFRINIQDSFCRWKKVKLEWNIL